MTSLAEEISKLSNPTPDVDDPEDEVNIETVAKLSEKYDEGETNIHQVSVLRTRNAPLLDEIDDRYAGKRISRKSFDEPFGQVELESGSGSEENESEEDPSFQLDEKEIELFKQEFKGKECKDEREEDSSNSNEFSTSDLSEASSDSADDDDDGGSEASTEDMVQKFSHIDVNEEIEKGKAVEKQQEIWNKLCECRIQLQKLLVVANKLPQFDKWAAFKEKSDKSYSDNLKKGCKSINNVLSSLLDLQSELLNYDPGINNANECVEDIKHEEIDDDEIISSCDEETEILPAKFHDSAETKVKKRKLKFEDYSEHLAKRHKSYIPYRNSVIQKWDEKTRLSTGRMTQKSFNAFDQAALKQIHQVLQDKSRLIKRTQLKRSVYRVLGKVEVVEGDNDETNEIKVKRDDHLKNYDPEIFDDDDFYRQLLKDVIESKSVGIDPMLLSKQLEMQRIRNKMKRKVDTRASKGRKIRFDVHRKLVNFMAPVITTTMTDEAREELFKSIFGQRGGTS